MTSPRRIRLWLALAFIALMIFGSFIVVRTAGGASRTTVTAYFENTNGMYPGDEVRILGVPVGKIASIEPQPLQAKVTFWIDAKYKVPAGAKAVILSPTLVTARFIQLTPAYTGGPQLQDHAVIPRDRTAEPVEFDDLRTQLKKLSKSLQPTQPAGASPIGAFIDTAANNLRGQGSSIRDTITKLSQTLSILGDHSGDIFGSVKNLALLVSTLQNSTDLMRRLNENLAAVTGLLSDDPNEVGSATADLNTAVADVQSFVADNREAIGVTSDKLGEVAQALGDSIDDVKQALHVFPNTVSNYVNLYQPAHASLTGAIAGSNFSNPINFFCGAIQAASRLNAEQSAKLCVQYLAPILKNRQYNFLTPIAAAGTPVPIPFPPFVVLPIGAVARPNEVTFSEDWLRPDYVPPAIAPTDPPTGAGPAPSKNSGPSAHPLAAEATPADQTIPPPPAATDPAAGLRGMMVRPGAGS
jgi:phospholipid/cholesterol/gamma-HCH transport system substrate-binding protein